MSNISKLIGSVVGAAVGFGTAKGFLPAEFNTPEIVAAITTLFAAVFVYYFPANKPTSE